jgi:hypothetical protein
MMSGPDKLELLRKEQYAAVVKGWAGFVVFKDGWCAVYGGRSV